jgi:hypothetical protein
MRATLADRRARGETGHAPRFLGCSARVEGWGGTTAHEIALAQRGQIIETKLLFHRAEGVDAFVVNDSLSPRHAECLLQRGKPWP